MPPIEVSARKGDPADTSADTRVVGVFEDETPADAVVAALVEAGEAKAAAKKLAVGHEDGGRRVIAVGLGKRDELDAEKARVAAAAVAGRAKELGTQALSWELPAEDVAGAIVEGTLLALYEFDRFKTKKDDDDSDSDDDNGLESLELASSDVDASDAAETARVTAEAQNAARDLQNLPANVATPTFLAERAQELANELDALECEVLDRDADRQARAWAPSRASPRAATRSRG